MRKRRDRKSTQSKQFQELYEIDGGPESNAAEPPEVQDSASGGGNYPPSESLKSQGTSPSGEYGGEGSRVAEGGWSSHGSEYRGEGERSGWSSSGSRETDRQGQWRNRTGRSL